MNSENQVKRAEFIQEWSKSGAKAPRELLPHEIEYRNRIRNSESPLMRPLATGDVDDKNYRRQLALVVDALDFFPYRPDMSWDSMWKAFENQLKLNFNDTNATKCLAKLSRELPERLIDEAWQGAPIRVYEYLHRRIVASQFNEDIGGQARKARGRLAHYLGGEWEEFLGWFDPSFPRGDAKTDRQGALFLYRFLRGEQVTVAGVRRRPSKNLKSDLLILGFLYTLRNEKTHGVSMPPFLSSRATARTYALPMYTTALVYTLLAVLWQYEGWGGWRRRIGNSTKVARKSCLYARYYGK